MRPDPEMIPVLMDTAKALKGSRRRLFMARTVHAMGRGGQLWAQAHLCWNRETIRKGLHKLRCGMTCVDAFSSGAPADSGISFLRGLERGIGSNPLRRLP